MKTWRWVGLFAFALAAALPAAASTFLAMTPEELVAQSDAVVQGRVLQVNSFWSPSGRLIMTEAMVQVDEAVTGNAPTVVVLRTAGGTVGGYTIEAHGFPEFQVNERLLLFIRNGEPGSVVGYRQGQYRIALSKEGVEMALPAVEAGVRLLTPDGQKAASPQPVRLDVFKDRIRAAGALRPLRATR
jgi:hypothetical protein